MSGDRPLPGSGKVRRAMAQFKAVTSVGSGHATVSLAGECDLTVQEELTKVLMAAIATSRPVVLDLDQLTFLDSTGVHALVMAHRAARAEGVALRAVNARGVVADLLGLTGVAELLHPSGGGDGGMSRAAGGGGDA